MDKKALFHKFISFTTSVHEVTHTLTQDVKADSVTSLQYKILENLKVSQPVTPTEISECMHMSMPNTSRELKKLYEQHLIEKIHDKEDRRKQYIRLSHDGENMMDEAFATIEVRFQKLIENCSEKDIEEVNNAMDILQKKFFSQ